MVGKSVQTGIVLGLMTIALRGSPLEGSEISPVDAPGGLAPSAAGIPPVISLLPSHFWQLKDPGELALIDDIGLVDHWDRADHLSETMTEMEGKAAESPFPIHPMWQNSGAELPGNEGESDSIPLPPLHDAPQTEPEWRTLTPAPGSISAAPFFPVDASSKLATFDEEISRGAETALGLLAQSGSGDAPLAPTPTPSFLSEPIPTPVLQEIPPAPMKGQSAEKEAAPDDPLFQKRFGELNRSLHGIGIGLSARSGAQPVNRAAEQAADAIPLLIWGGDGWVEPRPNRYPVPFAYQPLYYEEMNLERCGVGHGFLQPVVSSAAFVKNTITLPYHLVVTPPRSWEETPGDCPTCHKFPVLHK